jgi:ribosome-binding factor A
MEYKRADRVAGLLKEVVSEIIQKEVQDPRILLSTITDVEVSDNLKLAKVYFVCDSSKKKTAKEGFDHSKGFIKRRLASRVKLKFMPEIAFYYDNSFDYSSKIERILKEVKKEDDK